MGSYLSRIAEKIEREQICFFGFNGVDLEVIDLICKTYIGFNQSGYSEEIESALLDDSVWGLFDILSN